jgi:sugar lactone lactonase YvrE
LASLSVDLGTNTLSIVQPANLTLSGTAVYDDAADTVTIDLTILNSGFPRLIFNLKTLVTALAEGTVTGDGTFSGDPFVYYGPEALAPGAMTTRQVVINGVTGAVDPATADLELLDHVMAYVPGGGYGGTPNLAIDTSGSGMSGMVDHFALAFSGAGGDNGIQDAVISPDGRFLYLAARNQPMLIVVDTTTLTAVAGGDLTGNNNIQFDQTGSIGFVDGVVMSPDTLFLYALVTEGCHNYSTEGSNITGYGGPSLVANTTAWLVKLNRATLQEVGRVALTTNNAGAPSVGAKGLSLSPNGLRAACCLKNQGEVYLVETPTMTLFDADLGMAGSPPFDVSGHSLRPRHTTFSADGNTLYVAHSGGTDDKSLDVIDLTTRTVSPLAATANFAGYSYSETGDLVLGPDGRLYYTHPYKDTFPGLSIYDFGGGTWTDFHMAPDFISPNAMTFSSDGTRYWLYHNSGGPDDRLYQFEVGTDALVPNEADGADFIPLPSNGWGHTCVVSPF